MPDFADDANESAEMFLAAALRTQQQKATVAPEGIGFCLYCGEAVEGERRWCDADHRDAWEHEQRRRG